MKWFSSTLPRQSRPEIGRTPKAHGSGRMILELGLWLVGIALLATYILVTAGLERERTQGIDLFSEARAAAAASHRLEHLPLPGQIPSFPKVQGITTEVTPASVAGDAGLPIAVLRIGRLALEVPVYPNVNELNMSRGAGWIGGTAAPNTGGNMAIAAHRDRFFRPLKDIQVGDTLELESLAGHGEFRVTSIIIVDPDEVSVLADTRLPTLTLVTCYPFYFIGSAPRRYIVQAVTVNQSENASISDAISAALPPGETP